MEQERYFIGKDSSGHDYILPVKIRHKWDEYTINDIDAEDYDRQEEFENLFMHWRTGYALGCFTFTDPKLEKN